jgi:hypothetical protein
MEVRARALRQGWRWRAARSVRGKLSGVFPTEVGHAAVAKL